MSSPLLELRSIERSYGVVHALRPLHLTLNAGESVGLVGENGAGKSTLIRILSGVVPPSGGEFLWQGAPVRWSSPLDALRAGVATIHQELACCDHLTIAENLFLGEPWPRFPWGGIHWSKLFAQARERLASFDLPIDPTRWMGELSPAEKQEIAMVRALSLPTRLLILDEPTASLSDREVNRLFRRLTPLKARGVALLYVSHRLKEILELTQRVVVLRDGEKTAEYPTADATLDRMVSDMVGRSAQAMYPRQRASTPGDTVLSVSHLTRNELFQDISFSVAAGEIVGFAGLIGSGRSEVAQTVYGLAQPDGGSMEFCGRPWRPGSARDALDGGIVYLPEERKRQSLVLEHSVAHTIGFGFSDLFTRWGRIDATREAGGVRRGVQQFRVKCAALDQPIGTLSGGNQQKSLFARWLERDPRLIILDEPTRGVDVGAKAEIHAEIDRLAGAGKAVIVISSELPEVLGLSDRVFVLHEGRIAAELKGDQKTEERAMRAAAGFGATTGGLDA